MGIVLALSGLYLAMLSVRWWMIPEFSHQMPFWDQWLNEWPLVRAVALSEFRFLDLFASVNEHRIVPSRILQVATFLGNNQQWDSQVLMTVNSFIAAAIPLQMVWLFGRSKYATLDLRVLALVGLLWCGPMIWQNIIWAFQGPFYIMPLFSFAGMALVLAAPQFHLRWWVGMLCLLVAVVSLGSGLLAPASVAAWYLFRLRFPDRRPQEWIWTVLACAALAIGGALIRSSTLASQASTARNFSEFLLSLSKNLSFPWIVDVLEMAWSKPAPVLANSAWWAMVLWLPVPLLLCYVFVTGWQGGKTAVERGRLALLATSSFWVYGHLAVLAFARGAYGLPPSIRHYDVHTIGLLLNAVCVFTYGPAAIHIALGRLTSGTRVQGPAVYAIASAVYMALLLGGVVLQLKASYGYLTRQVEQKRSQVENIRGYLVTGDETLLQPKGFLTVPHWRIAELRETLDDPTFRRIAPSVLRPPVSLTPLPGASFGIEEAPLPEAVRKQTSGKIWISRSRGAKEGIGSLGVWELGSTPFPYLSFPYSGRTPDGVRTHLTVTPAGSKNWRARELERPPFTGWGYHLVQKRKGVHWVILQYPSTKGLIQLSDPHELGRLSYWCQALWKTSSLVFTSGALLLILGVKICVNARNTDDPLAETLGNGANRRQAADP